MSKVDKPSILAAAEAVIREKGAGKLTLDAVAKECGLSKGGLLHHFPNKLSLLKALLDYMLTSEDEMVAEFLTAGDNDFSPLGARIQAILHLVQDEGQVSRALIAAIAEEPSLIEPVRKHDEKTRLELSRASRDPELAEILLSAAKGLYLGTVFGVFDSDGEHFKRMHRRLITLAKDA